MDLTDDTQRVYRAMLVDPNLGVTSIAAQLGLSETAVRCALDALADAALLRPQPHDPDRLTPTPPRVALAHYVADAEAQLAEQSRRVQEMRHVLESIAAEYESSLQAERIVVHTDLGTIQGRLEQLALGARTECLSFNPGRAHLPSSMEASKPLNQVALEKGVAIKALYQDSFRLDPGTLDYARWLTGLGGEVRTLPEVPMLIILVDREVALLPRNPRNPAEGALEVGAPGLVAALVAYFESMWSIAEPLGGVSAPVETDINAMTRKVLELLAAGVTDEAAAHRLGVSARTVRRIVATVMADTGSDSRFQAGVEAVRRGWVH